MTTSSQPTNPGCRFRFLLYPLFILLPLLCMIPGILLGRWHYSAQAQGRFVKWQRLPDPPQKAQEILAADTNSIYVRTSGGIYYSRNVAGCIGEYVPCWEQVESVDKSSFGYPEYGADVHSTYKVPASPVAPVEELAVSKRRAETYDETYYVRGSTGEIWVWHCGNFSFGTIGLILLVYCGGMCWGILIGVGLAWLIVVKVK
jgi:hypothetical protein